MSDKNGKYPWIKSIFCKRNKQDNSITGVYAGPEKPVYAGPERTGKGEAEMNDVYGGPEFFDPSVQDEPDLPDENVADTAVDETRDEYDKFIRQNMTMCVYAGPEYFNGPSGQPAGQFSPNPPEPAVNPEQRDPDGKYCPGCGSPIIPGQKFCPECGTDINEND